MEAQKGALKSVHVTLAVRQQQLQEEAERQQRDDNSVSGFKHRIREQQKARKRVELERALAARLEAQRAVEERLEKLQQGEKRRLQVRPNHSDPFTMPNHSPCRFMPN